MAGEKKKSLKLSDMCGYCLGYSGFLIKKKKKKHCAPLIVYEARQQGMTYKGTTLLKLFCVYLDFLFERFFLKNIAGLILGSEVVTGSCPYARKKNFLWLIYLFLTEYLLNKSPHRMTAPPGNMLFLMRNWLFKYSEIRKNTHVIFLH